MMHHVIYEANVAQEQAELQDDAPLLRDPLLSVSLSDGVFLSMQVICQSYTSPQCQ
jgi:hypothetical protein